MRPCECECHTPPVSVQLNHIQAAINCGRITVEALALYLDQQGWCCHEPRQDERPEHKNYQATWDGLSAYLRDLETYCDRLERRDVPCPNPKCGQNYTVRCCEQCGETFDDAT